MSVPNQRRPATAGQPTICLLNHKTNNKSKANMSDQTNEVLARRNQSTPPLISAQARDLLNLRRLPAMLNSAQTAVMLGVAEHDIPLLVRTGLVEPLGEMPPNAVKYFCTQSILEMAGEAAVLNKIRDTIYQYWKGKNAQYARTRV
jgi:hypothetical protein